jgi:hypothetical protein
MSRKTTPGAEYFCWNVPPTRLKIFPLPVVNQNWSPPRYSIAVISSV